MTKRHCLQAHQLRCSLPQPLKPISLTRHSH
jgi:hypothetical protein